MLSEKTFRTLIEACPFGVVMVDADGTITFINSEMERLFGFSADDMLGAHIRYLIPAGLKGLPIAEATAPPAVSGNLAGVRKDGTEIPIEVSLKRISAAEGSLVLGVIVDIAERLRIERLKDEFVATVSHELRTPLTSISGALRLLASNGDGSLPGPALRLLTIAQSNSQRLVRLVNSILDMEKIESGKVVFVLRRVELRALLEQAIEANRGFAESFGVCIRMDEPCEVGAVRGDADWLIQVITNLLSNAVKFSPAGQEVVAGIEERGGKIRVFVRDHGIGIPDNFKPRIFEKFAQADNSDTRTKGGTGLGLSIVKQIVGRLGGEVAFSDAAGGGTVFYFDLPRWSAQRDAQSAVA